MKPDDRSPKPSHLAARHRIDLLEQELTGYRKDINQRRRMMSDLFEFIPDGYLVTDSEGIIRKANEAAATLFNLATRELIHQPLADFLIPADHGSFDDVLRGLHDGDRLRGREMQLLPHDHQPLDVQVSTAAYPRTGPPSNLCWLFHDITVIRQCKIQLRSLTARLQSVREEERTAMARDIHDAMGQELTVLKIGLAQLKTRHPQLADEIVPLLDGAGRLVTMVQRFATDLRPALLDHFGLAATIEWQTEQFSNHTGIPCDLELDQDDIALDTEQSTALFRILQEALTNIARHAEASRIRVALSRHRGFLHLRIEDDGKGVAENQIHAPGSLGLLGMRERARALGGRLHVVSRDRGGTRVCARIPL